LSEPLAFPHYLEGRYVVGFHAPSRAVFPLTGAERAATLEFGLEPASYTDKGQTNGVTFLLELTQPNLNPQEIFRRHLDPVKEPRDRGLQKERVLLPPFALGSKLTLRADPGPHGDNAWDWSYVTNLNIEKGAFLLEQFPGFTTAPSSVNGAYVGTMDTGQRFVFMLNAPGQLVFDLNGNQRTLTFSGGFMPGAHTGDGQSDGAGFVVELQPEQGPAQAVYSRYLDPRANPADTGLQNFRVDLPPHPAGAKLIVRTDPGPAQNASWDWTYICDLHLTGAASP
jgi:hypothetical protein